MASFTRLYTPQPLHTLQCGDSLKLESKPSHHLLKVLRTKQGQSLTLFNGDGSNYKVTLSGSEGNHALLTLDEKDKIDNESPLHITLLQGLSRGDRMDTALQKSVELGVNTIVPLTCERTNYAIKTDRIKKKMDHWQQIIISACEQSGRAVIPQLCDIQTFSHTVSEYSDSTNLILSLDSDKQLNELDKQGNKFCICIGPEGGLTDEEVALATKFNFQKILFGPRTLRTETAAPAVISALQVLWGDI